MEPAKLVRVIGLAEAVKAASPMAVSSSQEDGSESPSRPASSLASKEDLDI